LLKPVLDDPEYFEINENVTGHQPNILFLEHLTKYLFTYVSIQCAS